MHQPQHACNLCKPILPTWLSLSRSHRLQVLRQHLKLRVAQHRQMPRQQGQRGALHRLLHAQAAQLLGKQLKRLNECHSIYFIHCKTPFREPSITMARIPNQYPAIDLTDACIDQPKVAAAMALMRADAASSALALAEHDSAVRAVAQRLGYQLDTTDPDLIQRDIAANMRRSVEACLELGKGLCVLKTACGHGNFIARLDVLQMSPDLAQRLMQAAAKFSNTASTRLLNAVNSQTKLLELLCLDDEQIEEFELSGQSGALKLDDIASMSVKELRAKLREERLERAAEAKLLEQKNRRIDALERKAIAIECLVPDERLTHLMREAAAIARDAEGAVLGGLRQALLALNQHQPERGARREVYMAGLVGQVQARLSDLREEFNLPDVSKAADQKLLAEMDQWWKDSEPA